MGEAADQLEQHICEKRRELSANLRELRHQVKHAIDWRLQVREHPWTMVSLAFTAGFVASFLTNHPHRRGPGTSAGRHNRETSERWDNIMAALGALGAVAVAKAKDVLEDIIPGFREQYRKREYGGRNPPGVEGLKLSGTSRNSEER